MYVTYARYLILYTEDPKHFYLNYTSLYFTHHETNTSSPENLLDIFPEIAFERKEKTKEYLESLIWHEHEFAEIFNKLSLHTGLNSGGMGSTHRVLESF